MIKTDSTHCGPKRKEFNFASLDTIDTFVSMNVSLLYNGEIAISQRKETNSTNFANSRNVFSSFHTTFLHFQSLLFVLRKDIFESPYEFRVNLFAVARRFPG